MAVHALVYLNHRAEVVSSEELSVNICTHPARVRRVMAKLRGAGFVKTKEGSVGGGYQFISDPARLSLNEVAKALDIRFVETSWQSGSSDMDCQIASGMNRAHKPHKVLISLLCRCHKEFSLPKSALISYSIAYGGPYGKCIRPLRNASVQL